MVKAMDTRTLSRILILFPAPGIRILIRTSIPASLSTTNVLINAIHATGRIRFLAAIHAIIYATIHALAKIRAAANATSTKIVLSLDQDHTRFQCRILIKIYERCEMRDAIPEAEDSCKEEL
jgi:hypothetical protein